MCPPCCEDHGQKQLNQHRSLKLHVQSSKWQSERNLKSRVLGSKLKDELNGQLEITRDAGAGTFEVLVGEKTVWTITEKRPFPKLKAKDMGEVAELVRKAL